MSNPTNNRTSVFFPEIKENTKYNTSIVSVKYMRSTLGQLTPYQIDSINEQVHVVLENELPIYVLQTKNIVIYMSYFFCTISFT
jgi:hypothetical protein